MPSPVALTGPSHPPADGSKPRQLVVLLHGYGADGDDLIGLAPFFARALPQAEFVAPNAPERCGMGFGYQWFGISNLDPQLMLEGVRRARPVLEAYINQALRERNLGPTQLALIGFSQGTMMALDYIVHHPGAVAAAVGFSGLLAGSAPHLPADAKPPPILLVHGTADPVVPFERLTEAETALQAAGFPVETLVRPSLGHGIDPEGALAGARFLARHLVPQPAGGVS